jgi:hypothetical protein
MAYTQKQLYFIFNHAQSHVITCDHLHVLAALQMYFILSILTHLHFVSFAREIQFCTV